MIITQNVDNKNIAQKNIDKKKSIYIKKFKQHVMIKKFGKTIFRKTWDKHFCREIQFRYVVPNWLSPK